MKRRLLHLPPKCFRFHFAALSSNSKELPKNFKPQRPPHYRSTHPYVPLGTKLDEFPVCYFTMISSSIKIIFKMFSGYYI